MLRGKKKKQETRIEVSVVVVGFTVLERGSRKVSVKTELRPEGNVPILSR